MEKVIFDNYNLADAYEDTKEFLFDEYGEEPTDEDIWNTIYSYNSLDWEVAWAELKRFFSEGSYILFGSVGRWNGRVSGWEIFDDFEKAFCDAVKDCDYIKIYEENNHFYIMCSHHDGTNYYEIKKLKDSGIRYYDNWNYSWSDRRDSEYVGAQLVKRYSVLPGFFKICK